MNTPNILRTMIFHFSEMLTDFERIGDHVLNVGKELAQTGLKV